MPKVSINLVFDDASQESICDLWRRIDSHGLQVPGLTGYRPHITLSAHEAEAPDDWVRELAQVAHRSKPFPVRIDTVGSFVDNGVLYLGPRVSADLLELHHSVHEHILSASGSLPIAEFLYPNQWVPHITITTGKSIDELPSSLEIILREYQAIEAVATDLTVRIHPSTDDYLLFRLGSSEAAS